MLAGNNHITALIKETALHLDNSSTSIAIKN